MRSLLTVCAVLLVASVACAATPGQVPSATLDSFGLSGMQQMTDAQGLNIRGMGSPSISLSFTYVGTTYSANTNSNATNGLTIVGGANDSGKGSVTTVAVYGSTSGVGGATNFFGPTVYGVGGSFGANGLYLQISTTGGRGR
jgi:hypothetical protein